MKQLLLTHHSTPPLELSNISMAQYDYELPDERIAKYPLGQRDNSKLLVYGKSSITQHTFNQLPGLVPRGSLMVFNNTRVIRARIVFQRATGATIEVFLIEPSEPNDYESSFSTRTSCRWKCIVGNLRRWKEEVLSLLIPGNEELRLYARKQPTNGEGIDVEFSWEGNISFAQVVEQCGRVPIPPYLNRPDEEVDRSRYQTMYALPEGSVAAPTAGLHFVPELMNRIEKSGIGIGYLTLHVGAGTFKPVKTETIGEHEMHTERFFVERDMLKLIAKQGNNICSVGTTSLRTLESIYWLGVKIGMGAIGKGHPHLSQWEPYGLPKNVSLENAVHNILGWMEEHGTPVFEADTQLCIMPGYQFKVANMLVTNFHQPRSTLLLLVAAFVGERWRDIYDFALGNHFRFLSYGDGSLLFRQ